ncbi:MAG: O-antigen ligase family protein, partial [Elusimicrobia bacterium]|nr:O-antigen ligase family protein [Elusimicrobiota bacterium]
MTERVADWRTPTVAALLALVCLVPFNYMPYAAVPVGSSDVPLGWLIFFPAGAVLLLSAAWKFTRERSWPPFARWTLAIAASLLVSCAMASSKKLALSTAAGFVFRSVAVGWSGVLIGRDAGARERFIRWISIVAAVAAAAALFEIFTGHFFIFERALTPEQTPDELWPPGMGGVAAGAIGQPLPLSAALNAALPLALWMWSRRPTFARFVPTLLILAATLLTFRRSAFVIMVGSVIVTLLLTKRSLIKTAVGTILILIALIVAAPPTRMPFVWRFVPRSTIDELVHGQRTMVYRTAAKMVRSSPILGIGTRQFEKDYGRFADYEFPVNTPDSQYLRVAAENGLAGLTILVGFLFWLLRALWPANSEDGVP